MTIESPQEFWEIVCDELKKKVPEISYNLWLKDLYPLNMRQGEFVLGIYSKYKKEIIELNFMSFINAAFKRILGIDVTVTILAEDEEENIEPLREDNPNIPFESKLTFDNFIVGSTNRFAHAASMAVADNPKIIYNPLVIYGRSGVGKTHLLFAIKNHIAKKFPERKIEYIRCEDFTNQLISALHGGDIEEFRNKFRNVDVFLMDDIQFIAGKEQTQEEFFNTFNALCQNDKQIVVTLDRPPKEISTLDNRIRSRFESGLFADIVPPDFETKVGIIEKKAEELDIEVPQDVVFYMAEHIQDNTRQIEGVVKKIHAMIKIDGKNPNISSVQNLIKEVISDTKAEPVRIEKIIGEVSRTYNISENDMLSKRRNEELVKARQIAMYIAKETTDMAYQAIGEAFGKNHTTVLYSEKKVKELMREDSHEKMIIEDIIKNLRSE